MNAIHKIVSQRITYHAARGKEVCGKDGEYHAGWSAGRMGR